MRSPGLLDGGLSPRVRGNRFHDWDPETQQRSIPASAGEPAGLPIMGRVGWVYPRECGGTSRKSIPMLLANGLSPRVRGNPIIHAYPSTLPRSIPASAGEPNQPNAAAMACPVYPRECGGTEPCVVPQVTNLGLSPRVRGNRRVQFRTLHTLRSIPASAGEPASGFLVQGIRKVYPRECGGTVG